MSFTPALYMLRLTISVTRVFIMYLGYDIRLIVYAMTCSYVSTFADAVALWLY